LRDKKAEFDSMALKEMPNFEINNNNANYYRSLCDMLQELSEDFIDKAIPDMSVLKKSFSNSMADVMLDNYYYDDSYSEYPVVCVKWDQANLFSQCRTLYLNEFCLENHKNLYPSFFLPTSNQWNYVASNSEQRCCIYPWCVYYTRNSEGYLYGNFKSMDGDCNDNGHGSSYMSNVYMYDPNQLGVYDMGGNVSEWTRDAYDLGALYNCNAIDPVNDDPNNPMKVVVGANYHSPAREAQIGHMESQHKDVARPDIGFRNCMSIIETPTWHKSKGKGKKARSRSK
jgi:formylglycine-generating enzyme required for sulfatase activity